MQILCQEDNKVQLTAHSSQLTAQNMSAISHHAAQHDIRMLLCVVLHAEPRCPSGAVLSLEQDVP